MDLTDGDKKMLGAVHEVFYKARLIDSPQLANLGLQFTQFMQRVSEPPKPPTKEPMLKNVKEESRGGK